jgi:hypothetical protein
MPNTKQPTAVAFLFFAKLLKKLFLNRTGSVRVKCYNTLAAAKEHKNTERKQNENRRKTVIQELMQL